MSRRLIDLRSDTATRPTPPMREAMAGARVGDDAMGEDPSVNELTRRAAALFGKEEALFVPSGTMANQLAIKVHTNPGEEIVADALCHPYRSELGASAFLSGVQFALVSAPRGVYGRGEAEARLRPEGAHPRSALLWVENTHNQGGGGVFPLARLDELRALSRERGIPLHMDGARVFNAVVASDVPPPEWGARCDSMCFCLSKGLGCPVGSLLLGDRAFIREARRYRKMWGGGWRQAGVLAAAGLYALDRHVERLAEDHANARLFSELAAGVPGVRPLHDETPTNLVFLDVSETGKTARRLNEEAMRRGAAFSVPDERTLRAVTHLDVSSDDARAAARALAEAAK